MTRGRSVSMVDPWPLEPQRIVFEVKTCSRCRVGFSVVAVILLFR